MLSTLAISGYRSLRGLIIPLGPLNIITGANGSGKSNVYKALQLLAETAQGTVVAVLAREGGLESTLWAGPEQFSRAMGRGEQPVQGGPRKGAVSLKLGFASDDDSDFGYAIDLGLPTPAEATTSFLLDPVIKRECIWVGPVLRPAALLVDRRNSVVTRRGEHGTRDEWPIVTRHLRSFDSMLAQLSDPLAAPELWSMRQRIRSWRFYHHFRTDADAPARRAQLGTHTPVLSHDGADLAAALQTIREIGDPEALDAAVEDAFPGGAVDIAIERGRFELLMTQHGLLRPLTAAELSDGTLRYLLWIAALLTPRPPELLVLNEPETSLHPDLLPALGRLIASAAERSQIIVVSHASRLIATLGEDRRCRAIRLEKELGETRIVDDDDPPRWQWPSR